MTSLKSVLGCSLWRRENAVPLDGVFESHRDAASEAELPRLMGAAAEHASMLMAARHKKGHPTELGTR